MIQCPASSLLHLRLAKAIIDIIVDDDDDE